jgi:hypothetical protein
MPCSAGVVLAALTDAGLGRCGSKVVGLSMQQDKDPFPGIAGFGGDKD